MLFVLVISLINNLKVFTQAFVMSMAFQGSGEIVRTIVYHIYQIAFQFFEMGVASAAAMILLALVFILTWVQFKIAKE
jgi:multiple sugar transport system permease protein